MRRRDFHHRLAVGLGAPTSLLACAQPQPVQAPWAAIEGQANGRLGVAVLDTATGRLEGHRLDERFPMCSTFKWLAAAFVLHRVDAGQELLDRRIPYGRDALVTYSPVAEKHVGEGMTLAQLCHATITVSDNAAANLIMRTYGGPEALTAYIRSLGDNVTRLDRWEPDLNDVRSGDPRLLAAGPPPGARGGVPRRRDRTRREAQRSDCGRSCARDPQPLAPGG